MLMEEIDRVGIPGIAPGIGVLLVSVSKRNDKKPVVEKPRFRKHKEPLTLPSSMYGIYTYIYHHLP